MAASPSRDRSVPCAVLSVSDTLTPATDKSGQFIQLTLCNVKHRVVVYEIVPDCPDRLRAAIQAVGDRSDCQVIILTGGTGIGVRDYTCDVVSDLLDKELPGFGEIFRHLSFQEVGTQAIASRTLAGVYRGKLIFALPRAAAGVKLALEKLILPELLHLTAQLGTPKA